MALAKAGIAQIPNRAATQATSADRNSNETALLREHANARNWQHSTHALLNLHKRGDQTQRQIPILRHSVQRTEHRQVERMIDAARPAALALALLTLRESVPPAAADPFASAGTQAAAYTTIFLAGYLAVSLAVLALSQFRWFDKFQYPPELDAIGLAIFIALTPSLGPFWIFYLLAVFALAAVGKRTGVSLYESRMGNLFASDAGLLSAGAAIATVVRSAWLGPSGAQGALSGGTVGIWMLIAAVTYLGGLCAAWLGLRERTLEGKEGFVEMLLGLVRVEKGVAESVRLVLSELAREFDCERALLAICDEEVERVFTWAADQDRRHVIAPEVLPLGKAEAYLADN